MVIGLRRVAPLALLVSALPIGCFDSDDSSDSSNVVFGSGDQPSSTPACSFDETASYAGTSAPLTVDIDTSSPHAVPKDFVGADSELTATAMDWGNGKYQAAVKSLGISWVRYAAGTLSDAFDWSTGSFPEAWRNQFPYDNDKGALSAWADKDDAACLWNDRDSCPAGWGTEAMYSHWSTINQNKTGKMALPSWINFAKAAEVESFIDVNVFTDTDDSAGALAKKLHDAGVTVALFEMGNEEYLYENDASWKPSGGKNFFGNAADYLEHVAPYAAKIKAAMPGAHISISVNGYNNEWETDIANWTQHNDPFFDTLDAHIYPCPFNKAGTSDNSTEECMNYALGIADQYPTSILSHPGCGIGNGSCATEGAWRKGFVPRIVYTEVNADLEGGNGAQVVIPDNTHRGTMFNAIFLAEFVARTASCSSTEDCSIEHVAHTGLQSLYGNWFGLLNSVEDTPLRYELLKGTFAGNTEDLDYQVFTTAPGLAIQVLSGAIPRQVNVNNLTTKVSSANAPTVRACNPSVPKGDTFGVEDCTDGGAIHAFTFAEPGTNKYHTLVFNRGEHNANLDLQINGKAIDPAAPPTVTYVSDTDREAGNTSVVKSSDAVTAADIPWKTIDTKAVQEHSCELSAACGNGARCEGGSHYQVLPYSVARIDWVESTTSSKPDSATSSGDKTSGSGSSNSDCYTSTLAVFTGPTTSVASGACVDGTSNGEVYQCVSGRWVPAVDIPGETCTGGTQ